MTGKSGQGEVQFAARGSSRRIPTAAHLMELQSNGTTTMMYGNGGAKVEKDGSEDKLDKVLEVRERSTVNDKLRSCFITVVVLLHMSGCASISASCLVVVVNTSKPDVCHRMYFLWLVLGLRASHFPRYLPR